MSRSEAGSTRRTFLILLRRYIICKWWPDWMTWNNKISAMKVFLVKADESLYKFLIFTAHIYYYNRKHLCLNEGIFFRILTVSEVFILIGVALHYQLLISTCECISILVWFSWSDFLGLARAREKTIIAYSDLAVEMRLTPVRIYLECIPFPQRKRRLTYFTKETWSYVTSM